MPAPSDSMLVISPVAGERFARLDYTWSYNGKPQEGSLLVGFDPATESLTGHWIDTWHVGRQVMALTGARAEGRTVSLRGAYAAPPGPGWGWRIDLACESDVLRLTMFNISPLGQAYTAVERVCHRAREVRVQG